MAFSQTTIVGRLTADPKTNSVNGRNGESQTVANFSVATDRNYGDKTDFYDVVAWRGLADTVGKYLKKGRKVLVSGRMEMRTYTAETVQNRDQYEKRVWELVADKVEFLDGGNSSGEQNSPQPAAAEPSPFYGDGPSDDDLPF